jgi:hypothetical protein
MPVRAGDGHAGHELGNRSGMGKQSAVRASDFRIEARAHLRRQSSS